MRSIIFSQRYFDGRSKLRYLPLLSAMNAALKPPGRLPKQDWKSLHVSVRQNSCETSSPCISLESVS
jgi:hypothetical protein